LVEVFEFHPFSPITKAISVALYPLEAPLEVAPSRHTVLYGL
jgi:hypothetical protein